MVEPNRTEAVVEFDYVAQESDELSLRKGDVITDIRTQPGGWWEGTLAGKRGMFPDNFVRLKRDPITRTSSSSGLQKSSLEILSDSDIKDSIPSDVTLRSSSGRQCKVLFSYQPVNEDELQLQVNDVIDIITEVEEGWWKGKLNDSVGVFPSNFVTEVVDRPFEGASHATATTATNRKSRSSSREEASESDGELSTSVSSPDSSQLLDKDQDADAPILPPKPVKELCRALFPYSAANEDELTLKEGDLITLLSREVQDKGWWRGEIRGKMGVFPDNFVEIVLQDEQPKKPDRPPAKSHLATTNRTRDSITKPAAGEVTLRRSSDVPPRPDDRTSVVPPIPGKKPTLPPPIKKPQRIGVVPTGGVQSFVRQQHESAEQRLADVVDGAGPSRARGSRDEVAELGSGGFGRGSSYRTTKADMLPELYNMLGNRGLAGGSKEELNSSCLSHGLGRMMKDEVPEFDSVERSAMLVHPTASRAKAPRRRLPTNVYNKEAEPSTGLMNGNADVGHHELENHQEDGEDHEARGRLWEKNKVPWVEELKLNQARKSLSPRGPVPLGGACSPDPPTEKKPSPLPKEKPRSDQVHSHLISPQGLHPPAEPLTDPTAGKPTTSTAVTPRPHGTARPQSRPFSMISGSSSEQIRTASVSIKPVSLANRSVSPSLTTPTFTSKGDSHSPSSLSDCDVMSPAAAIPSPGTTVTSRQYLELREKVTKLEQSLEQQREMFTQALKEVTDKLNEEIARRHQLERDIDKLTNVVTQV